jgi:hypothetical protein
MIIGLMLFSGTSFASHSRHRRHHRHHVRHHSVRTHRADKHHFHHRHHAGPAVATYYNIGDSNPKLANGDSYGVNHDFFCAVDNSKRRLLNHDIDVVNKATGRHHRFLVADVGDFDPRNLDLSRRGSEYMNMPSRHGSPDNFRVEWRDCGINAAAASRHGHYRR